ncbi:MAG: hypothetical protein K2X29_05895, partial [Candidatus Obscuribacterales bacterium]|nr:hypothetical protein [Candidatus Obscuribacterales bacterium]
LVLLIALYVLSIVWRVSVAENEYFGRSELIPLRLPPRKFDSPPVLTSFGHKTYSFDSPTGRMVVWRQKINGFQHMYGSALACLELGDYCADKLFCMNEFAEYLCDWNGVDPSDLLDRKKDLVNNSLGRSIGLAARKARLKGHQAEEHIVKECILAVNSNPEFLSGYLDPRVLVLSEDRLGCKFLPERNFFNFVRLWTSRD